MQRYHRIRHRLMWLVLGPLVALVFIYAILNRPEIPVMDEGPGQTADQAE